MRGSFFAVCLLAFFATACAGGRVKSGVIGTKGEGGLFNTAAGSGRVPASENAADESLEGEVLGVKLQNTEFDMPVVYNEEVKEWLEYFTGSGRRHFAVYMERMARFQPIIQPKLKAAGVPQDLIYLAMIESGFSTQAKSHAGAVGPWQFMKSTGRMYGLQADWWSDERRDPLKSTDAAIEYLSRLYAEFGEWPLACAAYNSGEGRIRKAIRRLDTKDFWVIARDRKSLRRETKDYVPKMMAAAIIVKNAKQFGFRTHEPDPVLLNFETVKIPRAENLRTIAKVAGVDRDALEALNPELMRCCTPPQRQAYTLRLPKGKSAELVAAAVEAGELGRYAGFRRHVIRRGDNLSSIAARNGVPVDAILSMNEIRSVRALKPGTELVIPERAGNPSSSRASRSIASSPIPALKGHKTMVHVVQSGDTLYGISRRYAVGVEQIKRWNAIHRSKSLRPGSRIKLYVRNDPT
jgi:membrane-bound lytic murein transglycosylase D